MAEEEGFVDQFSEKGSREETAENSSRHWAFVLKNFKTEKLAFPKSVLLCLWQLQRGVSSDKKRLQGFIQFIKPVNKETLKGLFGGLGEAWYEPSVPAEDALPNICDVEWCISGPWAYFAKNWKEAMESDGYFTKRIEEIIKELSVKADDKDPHEVLMSEEKTEKSKEDISREVFFEKGKEDKNISAVNHTAKDALENIKNDVEQRKDANTTGNTEEGHADDETIKSSTAGTESVENHRNSNKEVIGNSKCVHSNTIEEDVLAVKNDRISDKNESEHLQYSGDDAFNENRRMGASVKRPGKKTLVKRREYGLKKKDVGDVLNECTVEKRLTRAKRSNKENIENGPDEKAVEKRPSSGKNKYNLSNKVPVSEKKAVKKKMSKNKQNTESSQEAVMKNEAGLPNWESSDQNEMVVVENCFGGESAKKENELNAIEEGLLGCGGIKLRSKDGSKISAAPTQKSARQSAKSVKKRELSHKRQLSRENEPAEMERASASVKIKLNKRLQDGNARFSPASDNFKDMGATSPVNAEDSGRASKQPEESGKRSERGSSPDKQGFAKGHDYCMASKCPPKPYLKKSKMHRKTERENLPCELLGAANEESEDRSRSKKLRKSARLAMKLPEESNGLMGMSNNISRPEFQTRSSPENTPSGSMVRNMSPHFLQANEAAKKEVWLLKDLMENGYGYIDLCLQYPALVKKCRKFIYQYQERLDGLDS